LPTPSHNPILIGNSKRFEVVSSLLFAGGDIFEGIIAGGDILEGLIIKY
jgi:hypothetical protein